MITDPSLNSAVMKYAPLILSLLPLAAMAQEDTPLPDPTRAGPRMKAALAGTTGTALPPLTMKGLVMTDSRERASVMLGAGEDLILARPGSSFLVNAGGSARAVKLKSIGAEGVTVEVEGSETPVLVSGYGPSDNDPPAEKGAVRFVLFRELPLIEALRMLSDQTGANFSASVESNCIPVSCMLRGVPAPRVVVRKIFSDLGYRDDVKALHVSKGKCWEIYGHDSAGKKVEIYFHPISGKIVELNKQD